MVTLVRDEVVDAEFPAAFADGYELTSDIDLITTVSHGLRMTIN
jgi:hypothetical protein